MILEGRSAIGYAEDHDLLLNKYADLVEGAREGLSIEEAEEIGREGDLLLIWLEIDNLAALETNRRTLMNLPCGCTPDASGFGYCGECTRKLREKIWSKMSEERKNYDRQFDPGGSKELDVAMTRYGSEPTCCSCHISAPCSYCVGSAGSERS